MRDTANSGKQRADRAKLTADSQLQDLTSQQPDDADTAGAAVQETLSEIADRDAQMRSLQRQVALDSCTCICAPCSSET